MSLLTKQRNINYRIKLSIYCCLKTIKLHMLIGGITKAISLIESRCKKTFF